MTIQATSADDTLLSEQYEFSLRDILVVLRQRRKIIFSTIIVFIAFTALFLFFATPLYKAYGTIQIKVAADKIVDIESVVSGVSPDDAAVQSEVDILTSRAIAGAVIDKLDLTNDEEFAPQGGIKKWLYSAISLDSDQDQDKQLSQEIRTRTINLFLDNLTVYRKPRSYTIWISFSSESPEKAEQIVNTIIEEYFLNQFSNKYEATKRANQWLNDKISALQTKLRESEMAVEIFSQENNLIESAGMTINEQQLSELNTHLILARSERAQAEARLAGAKKSISSSTEVLNSKLIQDLRRQEAEILRNKSDLSSRYGSRHPKIIKINAELNDLRDKINVEIEKIRRGLDKEVEIAKSREQSLERDLQNLQGKSGTDSKAKVQLAELVRERDANRMLYESFLNRSKETSNNQDLAQANARVISKAEKPIDAYFPKKKLMLVISAILGAILGIAIAFITHHLDNAFKSTDQLEKFTGTPSIGMVPQIDSKTNFISYVVTKFSSVFVESLRSILTSIHFSNPDNIPKTVLVTSSVPGEGKTTFSSCLATMVAKSGHKVLLIDCDMKRPAVAKKFGLNKVEYGLGDFLAGDITEKQLVHTDKKSGLHFIPSRPDTANSQDLLGSNKMKEFLEKAKKQYDLVILDSPPIMAVSDALVASKIVDTAVFVVHWDKTPRNVVKSCLIQLKNTKVRIAGSILTHVNMEKLSRYDYGERGYYYKNYRNYYTS